MLSRLFLSMPESVSSPLARLVLFTAYLAIAGSIVAGGYSLLAAHPQQAAPETPQDFLFGSGACLESCTGTGTTNYDTCMAGPKG